MAAVRSAGAGLSRLLSAAGMLNERIRIMGWYGRWYGFRPYVPVARRRAQAATFATKLAKKEKRTLCPVKLEGRKIAHSFWGQTWCDNLEGYSDFENRLPRGRTYVRNGSVIDLQIESGRIKAIVSGSEIYRVTINIDTLPRPLWQRIKRDCSESIASLIDLLQGRFDEGVMGRLTRREDGLFPKPREIKMKCSCPDWATLCKHVAAVLYGVGARLDTDPELLFKLRNVDHLELVGSAVAAENLDRALTADAGTGLAGNLGEIFGIDIDAGAGGPKASVRRKRSAVGPVSVQAVVERSPDSAASSPRARAKQPLPNKTRKRQAAKVLGGVRATAKRKHLSEKQ
jgi:uncharacterized Zn finger protein